MKRFLRQSGKYHGQCGYCGLQVFVRASQCSRCGVVTHAGCANEIKSNGQLFCHGMSTNTYAFMYQSSLICFTSSPIAPVCKVNNY